jgi:HTH-type transcriptional regulator / antitoxin HipB
MPVWEEATISQSFVAGLEAGKATLEAAKLFDVFKAFGLEVALRDRSSGDVRW